jgi:hypothetical protein
MSIKLASTVGEYCRHVLYRLYSTFFSLKERKFMVAEHGNKKKTPSYSFTSPSKLFLPNLLKTTE